VEEEKQEESTKPGSLEKMTFKKKVVVDRVYNRDIILYTLNIHNKYNE